MDGKIRRLFTLSNSCDEQRDSSDTSVAFCFSRTTQPTKFTLVSLTNKANGDRSTQTIIIMSNFHHHCYYYAPEQLQQALYRNNVGAHLIEMGQYEQAITILTSTLQEYNLIKHSFPQDDATALLSSSSSCSSYSPIILPLSHSNNSSEEEQEEENDTKFVYRRPIQIAHDWIPSNVTVVALSLIFNLALTYQLKAEMTMTARTTLAIHQQHHQQQHLFNRSRSLYELSYQLLMSQPHLFTVRVSLILCNNLGQVLQSTFETQKANECFTRLLSTVVYLQDNGVINNGSNANNGDSSNNDPASTNNEFMLPASDINGFLKSASHLVLQHATAAAA